MVEKQDQERSIPAECQNKFWSQTAIKYHYQVKVAVGDGAHPQNYTQQQHQTFIEFQTKKINSAVCDDS